MKATVTHVEIETTSEGLSMGLTVERTPDRWFCSEGPKARDFPPDLRRAIRAWLDASPEEAL